MQITKQFISELIGNLDQLTDEQILALIHLLEIQIRMRENLNNLLK